MGVRGLTTYLRENQRALSTSLELPAKHSASIVVDGWSFIYHLHLNSNLPWAYGGEYDQFCNLVAVVVKAWIKVGLRIYFVFDGASPEQKFSTIVSRLEESHVRPSLLFFRTSPFARRSTRFLNETQIIPPLAYTACVQALNTLVKTTDDLKIFFADMEGDPYAVELAGKIGAYVAGSDSDFVILNTEGYLGYIPLEEMVWHAPPPEETAPPEGDNEFTTVRKSKHRPMKETSTGRGILPPEADDLVLSFIVYKPAVLAAHLRIPVTLLPLLGSLLGNDFTKQSEANRRATHTLFFDRQLTLSQRINLVASTIREVLSPVSQKNRKKKKRIGSVMDLIDRAVNILLARFITNIGQGEVDNIVDKIAEATLQYAIARRENDTLTEGDNFQSSVCALHEPGVCPMLPFISRRVEAEQACSELTAVRAQYLNAYHNGHLAPELMDILFSATFWSQIFLENPDLETVGRSIGRPIREWTYSILDDALGLPSPPGEGTEEKSESSEEDMDELVDVVEYDSEDDGDPLAPLKDELNRLHGVETTSSDTAITPSPTPVVSEYLRRGTRVAQEMVTVRPLRELLTSIALPVINSQAPVFPSLRSVDDRLTVLLRALESDVPPVRQLPTKQLIPVLALRWAVRMMHLRSDETNSKERQKERWSKSEAFCFLASFDWTGEPALAPEERPPLLDRNVQLNAQVLEALQQTEHLSQALLLGGVLDSSVQLHSGRAFHKRLLEGDAERVEIAPSLTHAITHDLEYAFREDIYAKRPKRSDRGSTVPIKNVTRGTGLYSMLSEMK